MKFFFGILILLGTFSGDVLGRHCNDSQNSQIKHTLSEISIRLESLIGEAKEAVLLPEIKGSSKNKIKDVIWRFECMKKRINKVNYSCGSSICDKKKVEGHANRRNITVCADNLQTSLEDVLVHELSHVCGTVDIMYAPLRDGRPDFSELLNLPLKLNGWGANADHFSAWYSLGFCIPNVSC